MTVYSQYSMRCLVQNGVAVPVVSVGSTLTEPARKSFVGITEVSLFVI